MSSEKSRLEEELLAESNKLGDQITACESVEGELRKLKVLYEDKVAECTSLRDTLTQLNNNNDEKEKDMKSLQSILQVSPFIVFISLLTKGSMGRGGFYSRRHLPRWVHLGSFSC